MINSSICDCYLSADAAEDRLIAGNREADAAAAGVQPVHHCWLRTVYVREEKRLFSCKVTLSLVIRETPINEQQRNVTLVNITT